MTTNYDARIASLEPTDQSAVLAFIEFLEWKRADRPLIQDQARIECPTQRASRLRTIRETLGKTEEDAAAVAGVSLSTYLAGRKGGAA